MQFSSGKIYHAPSVYLLAYPSVEIAEKILNEEKHQPVEGVLSKERYHDGRFHMPATGSKAAQTLADLLKKSYDLKEKIDLIQPGEPFVYLGMSKNISVFARRQILDILTCKRKWIITGNWFGIYKA